MAMELFKGSDEPPRKGADIAGVREVLTGSEIGISGLSIFGYASDTRPVLPIIEHQHRNKFEVILVLRGMRRVSADGLEYTLYPNNAFFTCPNESHASLEQQPSYAEFFWFQLDMSSANGFLGLDSGKGTVLYDKLRRFGGRLLDLPPDLMQCFADVFTLLSEEDPLARLEGHALFITALIQLLRCKTPLCRLSPEIDAAKQYILLHLKELIDPDELLLASGLSMGEFRQRFESQIGYPPREYIIRQKIERAKQTLTRTNRTIADIAYEYHFSSSAFFKAQFRRLTGMSPQKYRRKHKNET